MNKSKSFIMAGLVVLVIGLGYLISIIEWNMVEEEVGLTREAEQDPLLAASLFLKSYQKDLSTLTTSESFLKNGSITLSKSSSSTPKLSLKFTLLEQSRTTHNIFSKHVLSI